MCFKTLKKKKKKTLGNTKRANSSKILRLMFAYVRFVFVRTDFVDLR